MTARRPIKLPFDPLPTMSTALSKTPLGSGGGLGFRRAVVAGA
jgi:hypothetical protein